MENMLVCVAIIFVIIVHETWRERYRVFERIQILHNDKIKKSSLST